MVTDGGGVFHQLIERELDEGPTADVHVIHMSVVHLDSGHQM